MIRNAIAGGAAGQANSPSGGRLPVGPDAHTATPIAAPAAEPLDDTVTHALDHAYQALDPDTARLYRDLGALPLPSARIDPGMAGAASGLDPAATIGHLTDLAKAGLIAPIDNSTIMCEFVAIDGRRHAAALGRREDGTDRTDTARRRALDWMVAEASTASRALHPFRRHVAHILYPPPHRAALATTAQALAWFHLRGPYLRTVLESADAHGLDDITAHLAHACWPWLLRQRDYTLWLWTYDHAIPAAQRLANPATPRPGASRLILRELYGARATVRRALGHHTDAMEDCHAALALARDDRDDTGQAQHLHDLGACAHEAHGHQLARVYLTEALRRRTELGNRRDTGVTRVALAITFHELGDSGAALLHLSTAHDELTAAGDDLNAARARAWQGRIHADRGEHAQADTAFAEAMNAFVTQNAPAWQARTLLWTAENTGATGSTDMAAEMLRHAHTLYAGSPSDQDKVATAARRLGITL
ncbi:hypothetical protein [Kitasatospora sp. NPDC058478]|uniref:hypothetical protein n=1 Tax=unclassified Kitasatospora TaxID=2633591 RepID=UPI00364AD0DA